MSKTIKILTIFTVIVMLIGGMSTPVFAEDFSPDKFTGTGSDAESLQGITNITNDIIAIITTIASAISVIVLIVLGIKYMVGSAEEKAEYKKTLLPYIIGAVLVFAASAIATVIFGFAQGISESAS